MFLLHGFLVQFVAVLAYPLKGILDRPEIDIAIGVLLARTPPALVTPATQLSPTDMSLLSSPWTPPSPTALDLAERINKLPLFWKRAMLQFLEEAEVMENGISAGEIDLDISHDGKPQTSYC